ncbi:hypothetical protein RRG08_054629 [Elysia crispata]|uniref:Uncharacterized protein n=1 Tax=Elysia crispata TaxID=231223 RepID=A0AAE1B108_9GAST|nr:hypothetical protein RRG08_054629 [Elysia crispata]
MFTDVNVSEEAQRQPCGRTFVYSSNNELLASWANRQQSPVITGSFHFSSYLCFTFSVLVVPCGLISKPSSERSVIGDNSLL